MDDRAPMILAEAFHERLRQEVPTDALGDEMRLPWVELEPEYREAYARAFEDLADRNLIELGAAGERAVESFRERTPGIV